MITKVRNKLSQPIPELSLLANETKVIFYNKTFWSKENYIRQGLLADAIEFLNDEGDVIVKAGGNGIPINNDIELSEVIIVCQTKGEEDKEDALYMIGLKVIASIRATFRRANIAGYTRAMLRSSLGSIPDLLRNGDFAEASTAIQAITTDGFWTGARKTKFKNLCDSVEI